MQIRPWPCLAAVLMASAAIKAQGQRPSFKTGVQLVRIDVSVLDGKRQPVRGLQASDFTVLEDGQPRPIRAFDAVDHAATSAGGATASVETTTGVATNQASNDASRLIFILMDRSIPTERPMLIARQIADAAVDAMAPGDMAAIVTTGTGVPQNLTSDRARLHKTIAASDWSQGLSQAQKDDPLVAASGIADPMTDGACLCGLCVMDTIARIANQVRDVPRRKILLFVGSDIIVQVGMKVGIHEKLDCAEMVQRSREKLFDALGTSGLTVHSIDPNGLASVGPQTRASVPNGQPQLGPAERYAMMTDERADFMKAQGNLDVLPDLTGGRTILNTNEPFRAVPEVLHESDVYYLVAFEPIESTGDVRHKIEVKVARKGVNVHTARYVRPPPADAVAGTAPISPLDRALTDLLPNAELPLEMSVATFAGADHRHAYVGVTIDASAFATGPGSVPLEIAVQASDERGRRAGAARQNGTIQVPASAGGMTPFVELQTYLTLPPGDYELRTAVMNTGTQAASSVFTHVTVPPFDGLALSDIVLGTRPNDGVLPDGAPAIPIIPTTARVFSASQPAWAFLRVYRTGDADAAGPVSPVSVDVSVLDGSGKRVKHQSLPAAAFGGRAADLRLALPLKGLAPGRYVLRFDATQGRAETTRAIGFALAQAAPTLTQQYSPALDAALAAAARYIDQYQHRISAIGAEEEYEQGAQTFPAGLAATDPRQPQSNRQAPTTRTVSRKTRANIMTISRGDRGWVSFRDVFEVDGQPVRDRVERLSRILQNVNSESLEQARRIAEESARYNLDADGTKIDRTINVPMTALQYLRAANQPRSVFRLGKPERVGGIDCVTLQFTEQATPRMIGTGDGAPAHGTFWIDMTGGGRVLKTELRIDSVGARAQAIRAQATVTYGRVDKLDVWLPAVMDETYELPDTRQVVTGHATYSNFLEFAVTTSEGIK